MVERSPSPLRRALDAQQPEPLRALLDDDLDEGRVKSMWERIDHAPRRGHGVWLLAVAAAAIALLAFGMFRDGETERLALLSGAAPVVLSADVAPATPRFEDGSTLGLARGSRLEVLRNDRRSFVTALRRGDVTFDVKPGGSRHWIIEAGELSVEVVGTRFRVERHGDGTKVSVEHGVVLVRGERVANGSVRLTAGGTFELRSPAAVADVTKAAPPAVVPPSTSATSATSATPATPATGEQRAPTPAPPTAEPEARDEVERSLRAADAARSRGDHSAALAHLEAAWRTAASGDPRRGLAALSLARLLIVANPAKAAELLRSSLSDMPQALTEDALARLVEAEARSGNAAAAAQAAAEYARRFPQGQRAKEVARWSRP